MVTVEPPRERKLILVIPPPPPPPAMLTSTVVPETLNVLPAPTKFNVFIGPLVMLVAPDVIPIIKPPVLVVTPLTFKNGSAAPVACKKVSPPTL